MLFGPPEPLRSSLLLTGAGPGNGGGGGPPLSNDTSLSVFTIDSEDVLALSNIQRGNGVTEVAVVAVPTHASATRTINGSADADPVMLNLSTGDNVVTVTVTAEDGVTTQDHVVTVRRLTAGVQEITEVVFPAGADFLTGGEGRGFIISNASSRLGLWGNTGAESVPTWTGVDTFIEVGFFDVDDGSAVAGAFAFALSSLGFSISGSGATRSFTCEVAGARTDAEAGPGFSAITVTVTQQGANPS